VTYADLWVSFAESAIGHSTLRPFSASDPLRGYNSDLAQYSHTPARNASRSDAGGPVLHHSA
jgi:hypothetical protein